MAARNHGTFEFDEASNERHFRFSDDVIPIMQAEIFVDENIEGNGATLIEGKRTAGRVASPRNKPLRNVVRGS